MKNTIPSSVSVVLLALAATAISTAQAYKVLHSFNGSESPMQHNATGADGGSPVGGLVLGRGSFLMGVRSLKTPAVQRAHSRRARRSGVSVHIWFAASRYGLPSIPRGFNRFLSIDFVHPG